MARLVTKNELRDVFNQNIQPQIDSGVYSRVPVTDRPASARVGEPPGTRSILFEIRDHQNRPIATCHAFIRTDGTVGASGLYDPKGVKVGDDWWYVL